MSKWNFLAFIEEFFKRIKSIELETDDNGRLVYNYPCDRILSIEAPALLQWTCVDDTLTIQAYSFTSMEEKWIIQDNNILAHYHVFKPQKTKIKITVK